MSLFAGTADNYRRHRSSVPDAVVQLLLPHVSRWSSGKPLRLLDLGTGTGLVVRALLPHFDDIIAVDPDADLLAAAHADLPGLAGQDVHLRLVQATAEEFEAPPGWEADLVTICRAFHWMDQPRVLRQLRANMAANGAVAVFGDASFWTSRAPWKVAMRELVQEFLGPDRRAGDGIYQHHLRPYRDVLAQAAYTVVAEHTVPVSRELSVDAVIGYLHSASFAAPPLFGPRLQKFDQAARERLGRFTASGTLVDDNPFHVLVARRPSP